MKKTKFYVCDKCGNILTGADNAEITCCGTAIYPLEAHKEDGEHFFNVQKTDGDYYITFDHPMTKEHYILFVAYVRFDRVFTLRLYPEQSGEVRMPEMHGGRLYFCCNKHGLFEAEV